MQIFPALPVIDFRNPNAHVLSVFTFMVHIKSTIFNVTLGILEKKENNKIQMHKDEFYHQTLSLFLSK